MNPAEDADDRRHEIFRNRSDDCGERRADHNADCQIDDVSAEYEFFKSVEHDCELAQPFNKYQAPRPTACATARTRATSSANSSGMSACSPSLFASSGLL